MIFPAMGARNDADQPIYSMTTSQMAPLFCGTDADFFDPSVHTIVAPLKGPQASTFEPVRYGDYLMERLDKNYSWKGPPRTMVSGNL
jgi:hypothetical protein